MTVPDLNQEPLAHYRQLLEKMAKTLRTPVDDKKFQDFEAIISNQEISKNFKSLGMHWFCCNIQNNTEIDLIAHPSSRAPSVPKVPQPLIWRYHHEKKYWTFLDQKNEMDFTLGLVHMDLR